MTSNQPTNRRPTPQRPSNTTPSTSSAGPNAMVVGLGIAALAGGLALLLLLIRGGGQTGVDDYTCGAPRVVGVDLSSQNRSDRHAALAADVIAGHTFAAAVCEEALTVVGVADGTPVLLELGDVVPELVGPNARARAQVARAHQSEIHDAASEAVLDAFATYPDVASTSIPALYDAVAAHADAGARVVLITTGVHDADDLTLNRPLAEGEGTSMAEAMTWPSLPDDATVTVIGVGQMDAEVPAPGELWPREVKAFNDAACAATGALECNIFQAAGIEQAQL
jgi:hypothetical protein